MAYEFKMQPVQSFPVLENPSQNLSIVDADHFQDGSPIFQLALFSSVADKNMDNGKIRHLNFYFWGKIDFGPSKKNG